MLNSVECGVNLFIYLFITFSKLLLLDYRCLVFSFSGAFYLHGEITQSTLCSGRIGPSNIISINV